MYRSRPYPKGCSGVARLVARLPPISSSPWLPESATEWMDSASIDDEPVSSHAMNFVKAMPRFAASAAMIALVPPPALTVVPFDRDCGARFAHSSRSLNPLRHGVAQLLH